MDYEPIVAVGLHTQNDARLLGPSFSNLWPIDESQYFSGLLRAIDEADRRLNGEDQRITH